MKIIIDSNEQKKLSGFEAYNTVDEVVVKKICHGDYACEYNNGEMSKTIFERKGVGDLFGTMGKGYERFKKEMKRAEKAGTKLIIIIEAPLSKVLKGYRYSKIKGYSILMKLFTLWVRYDLLPVFCDGREEMVRFIVEYFNAEGREKFCKKKTRRGKL